MSARRTGPPVGRRIREACELLEKLGQSGANALCAHVTDVEPSNMGKYCSRAVGLGLMTVKHGMRGRVKYSVFTVVPNWREIADMRQAINARPERTNGFVWSGVASVFQLGASL